MSAVSSPVSRVRPGWTSSSLKNKGSSPAACSTPLLTAFPGNDDEQERRQRRRSRVIDLQSANDSSFNDSASHSAVGTPAAVPKLSNAQISEHYSTCIKLSTENKITTKNAFGLHLIDYMADILKQKDSELTNFKVAAGTLDASTKIYAVRVDAVHADAYRVLGGLGAETKPGDGCGPEEERDDAAGDENANQPKKKRPPKRTVEQNLSNINSAESERKCEPTKENLHPSLWLGYEKPPEKRRRILQRIDSSDTRTPDGLDESVELCSTPPQPLLMPEHSGHAQGWRTTPIPKGPQSHAA